jgi:hypothetical protein
MKIKNEFIPYEQALALKELGFDESCFGRYYYKESYPMLNPNSGETELVFEFGQYIKQTEITILAPLYQQAFTWFREKYNLFSYIIPDDDGCDFTIMDINWGIDKEVHYNYRESSNCSYEKAELECLKKLIEIVKFK